MVWSIYTIYGIDSHTIWIVHTWKDDIPGVNTCMEGRHTWTLASEKQEHKVLHRSNTNLVRFYRREVRIRQNDLWMSDSQPVDPQGDRN